MNLAILQCDSVLDKYRGQFDNYPQMISTLFHRIDPNISFRTYNVELGEYPDNIDAHDAYITTGSKASVYQPLPWIDRLSDFILQLHKHDKKLFAICFGHQLVAQVFGGKTEKSPDGWGVGIHSNKTVVQKSWMNPQLKFINLIVSHQDQVTVLPPGAELITSSSFCPHSMFQLGNNILTVQGHPEFSKEYSRTLMHHRQKILGKDTFESGLKSLDAQTHEIEITNWFIEFIKCR